jgi:hypothetical protein
MAKTMAFRATRSVMVVRHADSAPDRDDWNAFIEAFVAAKVSKVLLWSPGMASPDSEQRASAVTAFRGKGATFRAALVTGSRVARGAATAISWFGPKIRGFALDDLPEAIAFLEVAAGEDAEIRATVDALARETS